MEKMMNEKNEVKRQTVSIYPGPELLREINNHWHHEQFMNRSQAIIDLIKRGLESVKKEREK